VDVAIAGGHGQVARRLARLLVQRGDRVRGLIRNPEHADDLRADGSDPVLLDLEAARPEQVAEAISGADAVVFAAGAGPGSGAERKFTMDRDGAIKLLEAARAAGVGRYLIVSSVGAESAPPEGEGDVFGAYLRAKADADAAVTASDREWTVVRPGPLTDDPGTGRLRLGTDPFRDAVTRDDVAAVVVAVLDEARSAGLILYVANGDEPVDEALAGVLA
jgi:nucleoside-diphosphate-sugar epimerase